MLCSFALGALSIDYTFFFAFLDLWKSNILHLFLLFIPMVSLLLILDCLLIMSELFLILALELVHNLVDLLNLLYYSIFTFSASFPLSAYLLAKIS